MKYEHEYYTYILANDRGMLYIGVTGDLFKRIIEHRTGIGSEYTKKYQCYRLVYYETFQYIYDAIAREKQLKTFNRKKKMELINTLNPSWKDLAEQFGDLNEFQATWLDLHAEDSRPPSF